MVALLPSLAPPSWDDGVFAQSLGQVRAAQSLASGDGAGRRQAAEEDQEGEREVLVPQGHRWLDLEVELLPHGPVCVDLACRLTVLVWHNFLSLTLN